ncbi:hypothetical protein M8J76_011777 [Diaphorina citri]|nr:hypothetical protein M8J76_011777 [Diaphorina citri]
MSEQGASSVSWSPPELESSRYYCHTCEAEFDNVTRRNDNCNNGFVEILENSPNSNLSEPNNQEIADDEDRHFLTTIIQEAFQRGLGLPVQMGPRDPRLRPRTGNDVHRINATIRNPGQHPLEHILSDLLVGIEATGFGEEGNSPLFFVGNPGDYAWGREGLDAIVTQLLNQMDGSGPPPLSTDKIKQIPVAHITKAQIDSNLQCSVCWEQFTLDEAVRKLPCDHFYHTPCIEPWLQLHGTCPICRQTLHSESAESLGPAGAGGPGGLNMATFGNLASALLGGTRGTSSRSNPNPSHPQADSAGSNSSGENSSSNSSAARRFFDMDFD